MQLAYYMLDKLGHDIHSIPIVFSAGAVAVAAATAAAVSTFS